MEMDNFSRIYPLSSSITVALRGSKQQQGLALTMRTPLALRGPTLIKDPSAVVSPPNPRGPTLVAFINSVTFISNGLCLFRFPSFMASSIRAEASMWVLPIPMAGTLGVHPRFFTSVVIHRAASSTTRSMLRSWNTR